MPYDCVALGAVKKSFMKTLRFAEFAQKGIKRIEAQI